jgi:hypothetical protein
MEAVASGNLAPIFARWDREAAARPAAVAAPAAPATPQAHRSDIRTTTGEEAGHGVRTWHKVGPHAVRAVRVNPDGSGGVDVAYAGVPTAELYAIAAAGESARERFACWDPAFSPPRGRPWEPPAARGSTSEGDWAWLERVTGRPVSMRDCGVARCEVRPWLDEHWPVIVAVADELLVRLDQGQCETSGEEFDAIVSRHWYRPRGN